MHAEAVRGRELLRSVYRSNGSLAPMRKLATFADGEDGRWAAVQGQLPPQLTTQASKVDRLFGDLNEDVAPLHLEQPPGKAADQTHGTPTAGPAPQGESQNGTETADSPTAPANTGSGHGGSTPGSPQGGVGSVLQHLTDPLTSGVGGVGGNTTPAPGSPAGKAAPSTAPSADPGSTPDGTQGLTIPPLLPGLLPGLTLK